MKYRLPFFFAFSLFFYSELKATVWLVGPTRTLTTPSAAAALVGAGDTVFIDAGVYTGDVAKWFAPNLLIRGVGSGRAHVEAAGVNAEGKAIWVVKGADCVIENIEFSGCTVPDNNGAGIRQEGQNLTLRNCYFHHNEMGILTSNDGVSRYLFEYCEFSHNGFGDGYSHNIYVGHVAALTMRFCYSHDAVVGHLVKSRAEENYLYYNRFSGESGTGSYEVDLPNGGLAVLIGNLIEQNEGSENGGIVAFGLEGGTNAAQRLAMAYNTVLNNRFSGRFVHVSNATTELKLVGNLFAGPGTPIQGAPVAPDTVANLWIVDIASAALTDPAQYDCIPTLASPCVDAGPADAGMIAGIDLNPAFEYVHPLQFQARGPSGMAPDIGAFELQQPSGVTFAAETDEFEVSPNPFGDYLRLQLARSTHADMPWRIRNELGGVCMSGVIFAHSKALEINSASLIPGVYLIEIEGFTPKKIIRL